MKVRKWHHLSATTNLKSDHAGLGAASSSCWASERSAAVRLLGVRLLDHVGEQLLGVRLPIAALLAARGRGVRQPAARAGGAAPNGHRRARGHRRAALPRASNSSQSSATAGCSERSARQAAARPHCVVTLEARAAPPSGAESEQLQRGVAARRRAARRAALPAARAYGGLRRQRRDLLRRVTDYLAQLAGDPADEAARAAAARRRGHQGTLGMGLQRRPQAEV